MCPAPSSEDWSELSSLIDLLLDAPPEQRASIIEDLSAGDRARRSELERLLDECQRELTLLSRPAAERFAALLYDDMARFPASLEERYRLTRELGRGGMATVYLVHDLKHDRAVALKVFHPELTAALGPGRFLREIRIAAALRHPHIVPLYDSGESDGLLYYVMPYVEGESLRDRLRREGQLPLGEALGIAREVAEALAHAHERELIHRDIKPENILLEGGHALVADFGIARAVGSARNGQVTAAGVAIGTPAYMSPEQALGEPGIDARSDVYSLGCVLYEMLAGEPPFAAATAQESIGRRLSEPAPEIRQIRATLPVGVEQAIITALARDQADRFPSAITFRDALVDRPEVPDHSAPGPTHDALAWDPRHAARRRIVGSAVLLVSVLAVVIGGMISQLRIRHASGLADQLTGRTTVAVLPFENLGSPEDEYFSAGISDEITARLASVSSISVIPRRAALQYAGSDMTIREIGRRLGVDYLLVGSVQWAPRESGSRNVRITIELLQARDQRQVWATTYDRVIDDIFEVQSDIAGQVIERLGITLPDGEQIRLRAPPTSNREAYVLYLKGRYFWNKRTEKDVETALDYFGQATDLDPGYSLAWVGIADAWIFRGWYSQLAPRETYPKAKAAALKALEFDSTLAEAHASKAMIHLEYDHDWVAAEREYRRAIHLNPRYPIAHHWYGGFLSAMARHGEALQQAELARELDPLSLIIQTWVGLRFYFARRYQEAIGEYLKALRLDDNFAPAHWHLAWAYEQAGQFEKGISEAQRAMAIDGDNLLYVASLGHVYARAGRAKEARATLAQLTRASEDRYVSAYHVALIYIALGDVNTGLDWLDRAYEEQSPWIGYMRVDPRLDPVRSQPRFQRLLTKARLDF
jgi:serine/threonine-protein kinase